MCLSSVIPANDTRKSVFGHQNFPRCEPGSNLGPLAPEASVVTTELVRPHLRENIYIVNYNSTKESLKLPVFILWYLNPITIYRWVTRCETGLSQAI